MELKIFLQTSLSLCFKQNHYTRTMARPIFIYFNIELNIIFIKKCYIKTKIICKTCLNIICVIKLYKNQNKFKQLQYI